MQKQLHVLEKCRLDIRFVVALCEIVGLDALAKPQVKEELTLVGEGSSHIVGTTCSIQTHIETCRIAHAILGCPILCCR